MGNAPDPTRHDRPSDPGSIAAPLRPVFVKKISNMGGHGASAVFPNYTVQGGNLMSFVKSEQQGAVAVLTIDRPKALNALNPEVRHVLRAA